MLSVRCLSVCLSFLSCPVLSVCDIGVLWPKGWMDQDATWCGGRPRPRPHCARWGPSSPSPKPQPPQIFGPCLLWPNGWMHQDATWYVGMPRPRPRCVRWGCSSPSPKRGHNPQFSAHVCCGQTAEPLSRLDQDATSYEGRPRPRPYCMWPDRWNVEGFRPKEREIP